MIKIRELAGDNGFLAKAAAAQIRKVRIGTDRTGREGFVVSSLKHPEEVAELRRIYGPGFFLFAIHKSKQKRLEHLIHDKAGMSREQAQELIDRDEAEEFSHGQHLRDTFHLADFFIHDEGDEEKLKYSIERCLDLIFGCPTLTPTFNEYAMFMAFASSLRSADLSRQVGAVIARERQILSNGANDCPCFGGGLYWADISERKRIEDVPEGRDYMRNYDSKNDVFRGYDSNAKEKAEMIDEVLTVLGQTVIDENRKKLQDGRIGDITEYGRVVHAEMEALLACARANVSCQGATLFCTTFPCHNCAKHIIAAGIEQVVFVEPYPKSKALLFHPDSSILEQESDQHVCFKPFVGVGPRRFFDLFSMSGGYGQPLKRKDSNGMVVAWEPKKAVPRTKLIPVTYHEFEETATEVIEDFSSLTEGGVS